MKIDYCKLLGHKWIPVYIIGCILGKEVRFIATECKRCKVGKEESLNILKILDSYSVCSYNEKYFID